MDGSLVSALKRVVVYENLSPEKINFIDECLKEILSNPVGEGLIRCVVTKLEAYHNLVNELAGTDVLNFPKESVEAIGVLYFVDVTDDGGKTALDLKIPERWSRIVPVKTIGVEINFDSITFIDEQGYFLTECLGGWDDVQHKLKIGAVFSPYYLTIAHELIHLKHYLDFVIEWLQAKKESRELAHSFEDIGTIYYFEALKISDASKLTEKALEIIKGEMAKRPRILLWPNLEERRKSLDLIKMGLAS